MNIDQLSQNFVAMNADFTVRDNTLHSEKPSSQLGIQPAESATSFAHAVNDAVRQVDSLQQTANEKMAAVDSGNSDDLIGAMLASQEARLSFLMLLQVRNKVVGALDDVLKMPL